MWTKAVHPKMHGSSVRLEGGFLNSERTCNGVFSFRIWVGRRLIRQVAVTRASGQKTFGTCDSIRRARVISNRMRFFRSATPFCSGGWGQVV
ncbi:hypothetical protein HanRHA438_Chr05g0226551 [Helianthus annuus]|nr:hypothetical protein HanRHA438_Chr05g0226551 [Helianthus annuus]